MDMVLGPLFIGLLFAAKIVYKILFSWWLDPWCQRKTNGSLWNDVQSNFYFLTSIGELVKEKPLRILPLDYASINVVFKNLCFCFTRGQGEVHISISPSHAPKEFTQLGYVIAALDSRDITALEPMGCLSEAAQVVRPRLDALDKAFSESEYPEFKKKLSHEKESGRIRTRQLEWELNKRLYH